MLIIALGLLAWFASKVGYHWRTSIPLAHQPQLLSSYSSSSHPAPTSRQQMALPGMRFGMLQPEDRPSAPPKELEITADVPKRDAVRDAFEWSYHRYGE